MTSNISQMNRPSAIEPSVIAFKVSCKKSQKPIDLDTLSEKPLRERITKGSNSSCVVDETFVIRIIQPFQKKRARHEDIKTHFATLLTDLYQEEDELAGDFVMYDSERLLDDYAQTFAKRRAQAYKNRAWYGLKMDGVGLPSDQIFTPSEILSIYQRTLRSLQEQLVRAKNDLPATQEAALGQFVHQKLVFSVNGINYACGPNSQASTVNREYNELCDELAQTKRRDNTTLLEIATSIVDKALHLQ